MTQDLAETILLDVPRYGTKSIGTRTFVGQDDQGEMVRLADVLAALTAAMDPALSERAGEVIESLRLWNRDDAADLITPLLAQNAALRAERDASNELGRAFEEDAGQQRERAEAAEAQIAALTARVERLTGALVAIDAMDPEDKINGFSESALRGTILHMGGIARAVLSATKEASHE